MVTAAYLSRDKTLMDEVLNNKDFHADNQKLFKLLERRIAKIFIFKLIYGGTPFGYSVDPMFNHLSNSVHFWTKLVDQFYEKYSGVKKWHEELVRKVVDTGRLIMPTGREYHYPRQDVVNRLWYWRPKILNYPVQGTGADIVCIGRVTAAKRLATMYDRGRVLWQSTVHDSIDLDVDFDEQGAYNIAYEIEKSFNDVPLNFYRLFGVNFDLPINVEVTYGPNLEDQKPYASNHSTSK